MVSYTKLYFYLCSYFVDLKFSVLFVETFLDVNEIKYRLNKTRNNSDKTVFTSLKKYF